MSARRPLNAKLIAGLAVATAVVLAAAGSLAWTPYPVDVVDVAGRLAPPSAAHLLGADYLGRDTLSLLLAGARSTLAVAVAAVALGLSVGVPAGLAAAALPGWPDDWLMRTNDLAFAFPALVLAILITAVFGPGATAAAIAIGLFNIPVFARLTRGAALSLWTQDFVLAARISGKGRARISAEHILPNLAGTLIVQAAIQTSIAIVADASLAYVGLGAQPPTPSWGRMLSEAQTRIADAPLQALIPGLAIVVAVVGVNLIGEGLRDRLDRRSLR